METITKEIKKHKTLTKEITASSVWKCCKCREEMYRGENSCNYCKHSRCGNCKRLES